MATFATTTAVATTRPPPFQKKNRSYSSLFAVLRRKPPFPPLIACPRRNVIPRRATDGLDDAPVREGSNEKEESYSVLTNFKTQYNDIVIVDTPNSRMLLLDPTHNIHSMLNKEKEWTGSYWDEFASLPAIIPQGPIAILGLGGGTAAHLMLKVWPFLQLEGWEIDELLIDMAREYFGLSQLEAGGSLKVHIGDALSPCATVEGGFAGIIVDLFADGKVLPQLKEVSTWLEISKKLMPSGRIIVNCGGADAERSTENGGASLSNGSWIQNATIKALCKAFPGELSWKRMAEEESDNYLALTGELPDLNAWAAALPHPICLGVKDWIPCELA